MQELILEYQQTKSEEVLKKLLKQYRPLLLKFSKRGGISFDDFYQESQLGFIEALNRYDESKGKFISYACLWIRKYINAFVVENQRIRIPQKFNLLVQRYKKLEKKPKNINEWVVSQKIFEDKVPKNVENLLENYSKSSFLLLDYNDEESENSSENLLYVDSFEDSLLDRINISKELYSDIVKVVGESYAKIFKMSVIDELNLREIADIMRCSNNNIHIKLKKTKQKLLKCEWFVNKYKGVI